MVSRVNRGPALRRTGLVLEETIMLTGNQPLPRLARTPWNKGRLVDQKRPLKPKDVWAIRVRLQLEQRKRDLALFNLAIDSTLGSSIAGSSALVSPARLTGLTRCGEPRRHRFIRKPAT